MELDNQCEHGQSDIVTKIVYIHVSYDITDAVLLLKVVSTSFPFFSLSNDSSLETECKNEFKGFSRMVLEVDHIVHPNV